MAAELILDWKKYIEASVAAVSEGVVLLKNDNNALPLEKGSSAAIFGRIQNHYYKSGTGSGGMVNVSHVTGIAEALKNGGFVNVDKTVSHAYEEWEKSNPFDKGVGWGCEPWSQKEMPLDDSLVSDASERCAAAIVIIGRTAGEEQDNTLSKGSYYLSDDEEKMLFVIRRYFKKMIVLLNVGSIIDMSFMDSCCPDAVMYVWQGGMIGGIGTADVLCGIRPPCGKLSDTIPFRVSDCLSNENFGDSQRNFYCEDIFVGYRYFETFAPDAVRYPFGFGLTYTSFCVECVSSCNINTSIFIEVKVTNTGKSSGKEVVQLYLEAPCGKLGKAKRVLCGFTKTHLLLSGAAEVLSFEIELADFASFDDSGALGCRVLESGEYRICAGTNVRNAEKVFSLRIHETTVIEKTEQALAPVIAFERYTAKYENDEFVLAKEPVRPSKIDEAVRREINLPREIAFSGDTGLKLCDVKSGKCNMDEFIAQLDDDALCCIIRGEGMGSPRVTAGTAAAFGGVSEGLEKLGIPCACCSDGPSGMRLDCGTKAFSLPNGTLLACTFNTEILEELFYCMGLEMAANKVDFLLGPGLNIHRHPLNGRNFEYFSEDPYLTGIMACAQLKGMSRAGVSGTVKHFCGNNQEAFRHDTDSVISERALREIYLKSFEIAVKKGGAISVMTTYGSVNGLWTGSCFDLTAQILRKEWGFCGISMTDWWSNLNERGKAPDKSNFGAMVRARNDIYMVCPDGSCNKGGDNTAEALKSGKITRGELQQCAKDILGVLMKTRAMRRLCGDDDRIVIINRPDDGENETDDAVTFYPIGKNSEISLEAVDAIGGESHVFALDVKYPGYYRVIISAKSESSDSAQLPVTLFCMGTPCGVFTWNGTNGRYTEIERTVKIFSRFTTCRLFFAQSGLKLGSIKFIFDEDLSVGFQP